MNKLNSFILSTLLFILFSGLSISKGFAQQNNQKDSISINNSQKTELSLLTKKDKKFTARGYVLGGISYIPSFNLSNNLTQEGLLNIDKMPVRNMGAGLLFEYKRFTTGMQISKIFYENSKDDFNYHFTGQKIDYNFAYRVLGKKENGLELGLMASQTNASLQLYSKDNSINLNSLRSSAIQSNNLEIDYEALSLGFTAAWVMKEGYQIPMEITFSYQRVLNTARWTSQYGTVINSPSERGQNMFSITSRFYLFKK